MPSTTTTSSRDAILPRRKIESLIAQGRKIVIVEDAVLKVDAWLPYHPGGDKAILHMVGRDATNEVKAFHSLDTQQLMQRYRIGKIPQGHWADFVPPIQGGDFKDEAETTESKEEDVSSASSGSEASPVVEPAEHRTASMGRRRRRRRANDDDVASESSATSLETLAIEDPSVWSHPKQSALDIRTQAEMDHDLEVFPSLDPQTQQTIVEKYKRLDERLRAEGLYSCNYAAYAIEVTRYTFLALTSLYFLRTGWYALSAVFLGMFWHQLVFTVHDAGHMGITHHFHIDSVIGIFISNFLGGLSCCWWKRNHNVHHIVTNSSEHDPDIQHMPFFAISHRFFSNLTSTYYDREMTFDAFAKKALQYQHLLYYPILCFGRFNLYVLSWQYIFLGQGPRKGPAWWHRYLEMAGQAFFWTWFGYLVVYKSIPTIPQRLLFVFLSHAITMPVHVQITLSHFAMSTADLGVKESFPQRMLRTTMDVECPQWLDFFHGGLQFQAVHHLFPRMPRHNLRAAQVLVREFCEEVRIPYAIYGFGEGNGKVIGRLGEVAQQARVLQECQRAAAKDLLEGH